MKEALERALAERADASVERILATSFFRSAAAPALVTGRPVATVIDLSDRRRRAAAT